MFRNKKINRDKKIALIKRRNSVHVSYNAFMIFPPRTSLFVTL